MVSERPVSIENSNLELWGSVKHHRTGFNRRVSQHNKFVERSDGRGGNTGEIHGTGRYQEEGSNVEEEIDWRSATCLGRYYRCCELSSMLDQLRQDKYSKALLAELRTNTARPLLAA